MEEQTRQIDLQIQDVQDSVAILRLRSLSPPVLPVTEVQERTTSAAIASNHLGYIANDDIVDDLHNRIVRQEAILENLRQRQRQILEAMDNETLPEYEHVNVEGMLSMRSGLSTLWSLCWTYAVICMKLFSTILFLNVMVAPLDKLQ